jgi:hypothetical protein
VERKDAYLALVEFPQDVFALPLSVCARVRIRMNTLEEEAAVLLRWLVKCKFYGVQQIHGVSWIFCVEKFTSA